jgi:integrase/recombinase XerC
MGSVRKLWQKNKRTGKVGKTSKYYCTYTDHTGRQRRVPAFPDRAASLQLLAKLEREAAEVRAGLRHPGSGDAARPLPELLREFADHKEAQGRSCGHVTNIRGNVAAVLDGCGWRTFADISADDLTRWAAGRLAGDDGVSPATVNTFLAPTKTFAKWVAKRCGMAHPLADFPLLNPDVDPRRNRHTPTPGELAALLSAAERAPRRRCLISGPDRAMLYRLAAYTGFRASELASLGHASFTFAPLPPLLERIPVAVTVAAADAKGRREDTVPIPLHVGVLLGPWLAAKPVGEPAWPGEWADDRRASRWVRRDCERAGVRRHTFHSLRSYYVTQLIMSGAKIHQVQKLARHRAPTTTLRAYARVRPEDLPGVVDLLPPPGGEG